MKNINQSSPIPMIIILLLITGCDGIGNKERPYADFAGIAFGSKRVDLESRGFICKENKDENKENKKTVVCTSFDKKENVLGRPVNERSVAFDANLRVESIHVKLPPAYSDLKSTLEIEADLSRFYEKDNSLVEISEPTAIVKHWKRPDGSLVRFSIVRIGMPGLIDDSVNMTVIPNEWAKSWQKKQ